MSAAAERVFAGYRLGECVGRGGFGMVHRAFPVATGTGGDQPSLCIKRGYPTWGGGKRMTRLFATSGPPTSQGIYADESPASALRYGTVIGVGSVSAAEVRRIIADEYAFLREQPPGLFPRVYVTGEAEEMTYYVMEYIAGLNLRYTLRRASTADRAVLLARFGPLVEALRDRHAADATFFHGDFKPDNIIVAAEGGLRLIDPALRPVSYKGMDGYLTGSGPHITITVAYNPLGVRGEQADTTALAITLFELLTGQQPFHTWDQPLWLDTGAIALDDDRSIQSFLDLNRFASFRQNQFLAQLLDWIAFPPTYAEMHAFLAAHPDGAGKIDPAWQPIAPLPIVEPPPFPVPPPHWLEDGPILPPVPMTLANQWLMAAMSRAIAVVCTDGSVQRGTVVAFDSESVQLEIAAGSSMLIARHAIIRMYDDGEH